MKQDYLDEIESIIRISERETTRKVLRDLRTTLEDRALMYEKVLDSHESRYILTQSIGYRSNMLYRQRSILRSKSIQLWQICILINETINNLK